MNIKEAKEQIRNAMTAYFSKNEFGEYEIPIERQRPIFLIGAPGIGKTAVMEQVAAEMHVGLVTYSMTHHTRQSALGLPFIEKKTYGGKEYSVSEYTMSEIIASVYDMMEETGVKEGILFLDEINCVSETLAPSMLQFLQYKIFGRHRVPDGWIVVTAGNPPEYNNSVRDFDIVTWDRLKRIEVTPDYTVWKEYAYKQGVHPSILTYLDIKTNDFYSVETTVNGKSFVTARGWTDLSNMIRLYEKNGLTVDEKLVGQYLQNARIAKSFAIYYDLFNKYRSDYQIPKILAGKEDESVRARAAAAKFDERLSLLGLLLDGAVEKIRAVCEEEAVQFSFMHILTNMRPALARPGADVQDALDAQIRAVLEKLEAGKHAASLSGEDQRTLRSTAQRLEEEKVRLAENAPQNAAEAFMRLQTDFNDRTKELKKHAKEVQTALSNMFGFCEKVFGEGQELLILVTEMTINDYSARFISRYGCEEYFAHNKELLFYERQKEIITELEDLTLDELPAPENL